MTNTIRSDLESQGHWVPEDVSPLLIIMMRALAKTYVGSPGSRDTRQVLSDVLTKDGDDHGDLYGLARAAIQAIPAEVLVSKGGCGGEPTFATFSDQDADEIVKRTCDFWEVNDSMWPGLERVPLIKR